MENKESRIVRKVNINPYLTNLGEVNYSAFFISWIFSFFSILGVVMFVFYMDKGDDYFAVLNAVQKDIQVIFNYFITNIISTMNNLNSINDILFGGMKIFNFDFRTTILPPLSIEGWLIVIITSILTMKVYFLTLLQIKNQKLLKNSNFSNFYIPMVFTLSFLFRHKNKKCNIKLIEILKMEPLNPKNQVQRNLVLQTVFKVPYDDLEIYTIKVESKSFFYGWYHYQNWEVVEDIKLQKQNNEDESKRLTRKQKRAIKLNI